MPRRRKQDLLDELDHEIIRRLQFGRVSNTDLARQLNTSESTIRKRVDRLLHAEIIRIAAVANPQKLYPVTAILGIQAVPNKISDVAKALEELTELRFIALTTGVYDFIAEAWFREQDDLRRFLTDRLLRIDGMARVETAHVLQYIRAGVATPPETDGHAFAPTRQRANRP